MEYFRGYLKNDISVIPCEYEDVERALAENFKEETIRYGESVVTKNKD